ncbi:MAG TPA: YceI family protein [Gammaproteobacteria bacterium]|nr:YceI family protein [Gammaproteobacteria bacterium]
MHLKKTQKKFKFYGYRKEYFFGLKRFFLIFLLLPLLAGAQTVPAWKIVPHESTLTFTATQNGAPTTGTFSNFSGDIHFDPSQLDKSNVKIIVNMSSISDAYNQLSDTLKSAEWFNAKVFPQAVFQSSGFTKTGEKTYQAQGNLTIRDKTQPIILNFTLEEFSSTAKITGNTTIKRTAFGVGQGEWSDTKTVKDDVQVNFKVSAVRE